MSNNNWNNGQIKPHLSEVTINNIVVPVHINKEVYKIIQYYCHKINKVEWSGILFYELKGSMREPEKMKVICKDIYIMNKGTATYTSFDTDTSIAKYILTNKLLGCKMGLIHSHNTMATFFSAEDWDELHTTAPVHNFFLSLIVNNFGDAVAKIAFVGKSETKFIHQYFSRDENGDDYLIENIEVPVSHSKLYIYDCEVIQPKSKIVVNQSYMDRLSVIENKAKQAEEERKAKALLTQSNKPTVVGLAGKTLNNFTYFQDEENQNSLQQTFDAEIEQISKEEAFFTFCLRLGKLNEEDTIEDCINDMEAYNMAAMSMKETIINSLPKFYCQYFDIPSEEDISPSKFCQLLATFKSHLEEEKNERGEELNEFLEVFIPALTTYIDKCTSTKSTQPTAN